ncbi:MAG: laccase domain-containing protein, partial [Candidatus Binatia bacterium]|nr:laccase domain-containing protein [Candidatus Binatia bacterium]
MKHYWDDWVVETDLYGELDLSECALIKQAHGNKIIVRQDIDSGSVGDGIITTGESAAIYTADCLPLVLLTKQMALILHVSRKSLVCGLLEKAAERIDGLPETDVAAYIGPHICRRHFEFAYLGEEAKRFTLKYPDSVYRQNGSWYFSLRRAVGGYL